jgi:hypothetical protein
LFAIWAEADVRRLGYDHQDKTGERHLDLQDSEQSPLSTISPLVTEPAIMPPAAASYRAAI